MATRELDRALGALGVEEEELEAACAALASLIPIREDELREMAGEHRLAAGRLLGRRPRARASWSALRAVLVGLVRDHDQALAWLRAREHALVRAYLALDARAELDDDARALLRRTLIPTAFDHFTRIDRLLAAADDLPSSAWI